MAKTKQPRRTPNTGAGKGPAFEREVFQFLKDGGFRVIPNARGAKPRQSDFFARDTATSYVVEVKNRKSKTTSADIDDLRKRLERVPPDFVGILFSMSELNDDAIKEIETHRRQEIIAFAADEIDMLRNQQINLSTAIERKRLELRNNGVAWFGPHGGTQYANVSLPKSPYSIEVEGEVVPFMQSRSGHLHTAFTLPMRGEGWAYNLGTSLNLQLTINSIEQLRDILGYLHEHFGLTNEGAFCIQQSQVCWHGMGAEAFVDAVENWRQRYESSGASHHHHSESIWYFDTLRNGWLVLAFQQSSGKKHRIFHHQELDIVLEGNPVQSAPYLDLCRYTGNMWAQFQALRTYESFRHELRKPIRVSVAGQVCVRLEALADGDHAHEPSVRGLIIRNPFFGKKSLPKELKTEHASGLHDLTRVEHIFCDLRDWHPRGDVAEAYMLEGLDVLSFPRTSCIRAFGTWTKMKHKPGKARKAKLKTLTIDDIAKLFETITDG
jgi:hypothetical protein